MKKMLFESGKSKILVASLIIALAANVFPTYGNSSDSEFIEIADAKCEQPECDGEGSGCSVTVMGTVFVSSACKAKPVETR